MSTAGLGHPHGITCRRIAWPGTPSERQACLHVCRNRWLLVDGVTAATGCSLGHRTLRLMDYGKVATSCVDTESGRAVRIWPSPQCRALASYYAPVAPSRWRAQLESYQIMPAAELLSACEVELLIDLKELIARRGVRVNCSICGEEILNQREVIRDDKMLCRFCASGGYVRFLSTHSQG